MNKKLRTYLESLGLKATATEAQAWAFLAGLEGEPADAARKLVDVEDETETVVTGDAVDAAAEVAAAEQTAEATAAPAAGAVATVTPAVDPAAAVQTALTAERTRVQGIMTLATRFHMPAGWAQRQISGGTSLAAAKETILERLAAVQGPVRVAVGEDLNRSTIGQAVVDALLLRAGRTLAEENAEGQLVARQAHPRTLSLRGISAASLAREFLRGIGMVVAGMADSQCVKALFNREYMGVHSSSDFDNILSTSMNKSLQREYALKPKAWPKWCSRNTAANFQQQERPRLAEAPALAIVKEGGEYTLCTIGDSKEVYSLVKYGKAFDLTWEAMLADNLGAFGGLATRFYNAAIRLEDVIAFTLLYTNANMGDSHALFDATYHGNLATGSDIDPPSVATLNVMRKAMRVQTSGATLAAGGQVLNIEPRYLIAPAALEGTVKQLLASMSNPASSNAGVANIWQNGLEPIIDATLDGSSTAFWYGAADPGLTETVEVCFLRGYETPTLEVTDRLNPDKRTFNIRHVVAAKALDWRGLYANAGTA